MIINKNGIIDSDLKYDRYEYIPYKERRLPLSDCKSILLEIFEDNNPEIILGCVEILPFTQNNEMNILMMCHFFEYDEDGEINTKGFISNIIYTLHDNEDISSVSDQVSSALIYLIHLTLNYSEDYDDIEIIRETYDSIEDDEENFWEEINKYFSIQAYYIKKEEEE